MMQIPEHYPPVMVEITQLLRERLDGHIPEDQADALALAQADKLVQAFSGCQIYFPKEDVHRRKKRNRAICEAFDGNNHRELSRRYKLTIGQIYVILARTRASLSSATEGCPTP